MSSAGMFFCGAFPCAFVFSSLFHTTFMQQKLQCCSYLTVLKSATVRTGQSNLASFHCITFLLQEKKKKSGNL